MLFGSHHKFSSINLMMNSIEDHSISISSSCKVKRKHAT
ncbi:hypothetical protein [Caulobacter phage Cr30]|nr:hypothetical protein OZ74_gp215 [Caulobacter phage Cr30]AGS81128.1 hypothetical protein [Caulobacter phage Cr30]